MTGDVRRDFVNQVKSIDPVFKRGNLRAFWPALRDLIAMAPDRADLSKKKSHYLASLAVRSLGRGDASSALAFLDLADEALEPSHLTEFLLEERAELRRQTESTLAKTEPT